MDWLTLVGLIAFFILGVGGVVYGFMKGLGKKKGQMYLVVGVAGLLIGGFLAGSTINSFLSTPGSFTNPPSTGGLSPQVCIINVAGATIGAGTCASSSNGILTTKLGQPGTFTAGGISGTTNKFAYLLANITITPASGANTVSQNIIMDVVTPVQSVSNTSNSANFGPVLGTETSGAYSVLLGGSDFQHHIALVTAGTAVTVTLRALWGNALTELAVAQYPVGISFSISFTIQGQGSPFATLTFSESVQHN